MAIEDESAKYEVYKNLAKGTEKIVCDSLEGLDLKKKKMRSSIWIHVNAKTEEDLAEIQELFGFHKLAIEDAVDSKQRPKIDIFDDYVLIIVKDLGINHSLVANHLALFLGKNYLVTVSPKRLERVDLVAENLRRGLFRTKNVDSIAYRLLDRIVDNYFPVVDRVEDDIERIEEKISKKKNHEELSDSIFEARRKLLTLRKNLWPTREVFSALSKGDLHQISKRNRVYYRDIYDHVVQAIDLIETYRELLSGILETHLSSISNSLNEVMKVLTVIATIFIPLTFITGLYGMNFQNMPEIYWDMGYPFSLLLMLIVGLGMVAYFRKKGWI